MPDASTAPVAEAPLDVMDKEVVARIHWTLHEGLGAVTLRQLIDKFGSAHDAFSADKKKLPPAGPPGARRA